MGNYTYTPKDPWRWHRAEIKDIPEIVELVDTYYSAEIHNVIFKKNASRFNYHLQRAVLDQLYNLPTQNISIARDVNTDRLIAWAWIERGKYMVYADEEIAVAEFAHVALDLPVRSRIRLLAQTLEIWIAWAEINQIPVLCSTSIRTDQTAFMRLHEQFGFVVRGSYAYRKIV